MSGSHHAAAGSSHRPADYDSAGSHHRSSGRFHDDGDQLGHRDGGGEAARSTLAHSRASFWPVGPHAPDTGAVEHSGEEEGDSRGLAEWVARLLASQGGACLTGQLSGLLQADCPARYRALKDRFLSLTILLDKFPDLFTLDASATGTIARLAQPSPGLPPHAGPPTDAAQMHGGDAVYPVSTSSVSRTGGGVWGPPGRCHSSAVHAPCLRGPSPGPAPASSALAGPTTDAASGLCARERAASGSRSPGVASSASITPLSTSSAAPALVSGLPTPPLPSHDAERDAFGKSSRAYPDGSPQSLSASWARVGGDAAPPAASGTRSSCGHMRSSPLHHGAHYDDVGAAAWRQHPSGIPDDGAHPHPSLSSVAAYSSATPAAVPRSTLASAPASRPRLGEGARGEEGGGQEGEGGAHSGTDADGPVSRCLHIGNVPMDMPESELLDVLRVHGAVETIKLVTQKGRRFAFCNFYTAEEAIAAKSSLSRSVIWRYNVSFAKRETLPQAPPPSSSCSSYGGRPVPVPPSVSMTEQLVKQGYPLEQAAYLAGCVNPSEGGHSMRQRNLAPSRHLWIGGLATATRADILDAFGPFGKIEHFKFIKGRHCAFVDFQDQRDAETAFQRMQGAVISGSYIDLGFGRPERASSAHTIASEDLGLDDNHVPGGAYRTPRVSKHDPLYEYMGRGARPPPPPSYHTGPPAQPWPPQGAYHGVRGAPCGYYRDHHEGVYGGGGVYATGGLPPPAPGHGAYPSGSPYAMMGHGAPPGRPHRPPPVSRSYTEPVARGYGRHHSSGSHGMPSESASQADLDLSSFADLMRGSHLEDDDAPGPHHERRSL